MTMKKTLLKKVIPIVAIGLFGIGAFIGTQGDRLKYGKIHEKFPQVERNLIYGYVSNFKDLDNTTIENVKELEEKASEKYGVSAPLIILGGLSLLGASAYNLRK